MAHPLVIDRLQLHTPSGRLQHAIQATLRQTLNQLVIAQAQLPSGALLQIRDLAVQAAFPHDPLRQRQWLDEVTATIVSHAQAAQRPAVVGAGAGAAANSVLFLDAAEMLLCYTQDQLAGRRLWYWPMILGTGYARLDQIVTVWRRYPMAVPTVLTHLPAAAVRRALRGASAADVAQLSAALHQHYQLPNVGVAVDRAIDKRWQSVLSASDTQGLSPQAIYVWELGRSLARDASLTRRSEMVAAIWQTAHQQAGQSADEQVTTDELVAISQAESDQDPRAWVADAYERLQTEVGGILYLIHVVEWVLAVSGADDIERVNRWGLVAALGQVLLGDAFVVYADDALWHFLETRLPHPDGALWGHDFAADFCFQVKPESLAAWGIETVRYVLEEDGERLRMVADEAALILWDGLADAFVPEALSDTFAAAGIALQQIGKRQAAPVLSVASEVEPALARWVQCVLPLCDWRLRLSGVALPVRWDTLLQLPASVQSTFTHIDMYADLERIQRVCRRAGLDQNPAWMPDYGYIIYFHFVG